MEGKEYNEDSINEQQNENNTESTENTNKLDDNVRKQTHKYNYIATIFIFIVSFIFVLYDKGLFSKLINDDSNTGMGELILDNIIVAIVVMFFGILTYEGGKLGGFVNNINTNIFKIILGLVFFIIYIALLGYYGIESF